MTPMIEPFFDPATATISYVVADRDSRRCAIIDPVADYEPRSGRIATTAADRIVAYVRDNGLAVDWILETHAHADHLSGAAYLKDALGGRIKQLSHQRGIMSDGMLRQINEQHLFKKPLGSPRLALIPLRTVALLARR